MADAEYVIDIASRMPDGPATSAQLDVLTNRLKGAGRDSDLFEKAIQRVSAQLDSAKRATAGAAQELADAQSEYRSFEKAALKASKALERGFKRGLEGADLAQLEEELDHAQYALDVHAGRLKEVETRAESAAQAEDKLAKSLRKIRGASQHVTKSLGDTTRGVSVFRGALGDVGGPVGEFGERLLYPVQAFADLNEQFGAGVASATVLGVGVASLAAILVTVTAVTSLAVAAFGALAIKLADNRREANLAREAFEAMDPTLVTLRDDFAALEKSTGVGTDRLRDLKSKLDDAKVSGADMSRALEAAATAEAALGAGGADKFIADIKDGKLSVDEFATSTQQKLGGIVARQMLGLDAQAATLKRNLSGLFGGLAIEPVLKGVQRLVALFDTTTEAGEALKFLFESFFQPLIDQAEKVSVVIEAFYLGFLIGLTKVYIALKPVIAAVKEFFGFEDTSLTDMLNNAEAIGSAVAYTFAFFAATMAAVVVAIGAVVKAGVWLYDSLTDLLGGSIWGELGSAIVRGLADGILGGAGTVISAMVNVARNAIAAAKKALGIASPSKVFAEIGGFTGEGFTEGVEKEEASAKGALESLVSPPPMSSPLASVGPTASASAVPEGGAATVAAAGGGGGGGGFDMSGATINFYGVEGAEDAESRFSELLTRTLEGDAEALGAAEVA